jgi:hypothetical protein
MQKELLNKDEINTIRELRVLRNNAIHRGESPTEKSTKQILHNIANVMQKHELFSTTGEEETVTRNFLCILYYMSRGDSQIEKHGIEPLEIYAKLELNAIKDENLIRFRIKEIVQNNINRGYIEVIGFNDRVKITQAGNEYCYSNCGGAPTPT